MSFFILWLSAKVRGHRGATMSSQLGVQFLGLGYYYPSTEKIDGSTQFGAIGYIITLFSKKLRKKLGVRPNLGSPDPPKPPVVAPMIGYRTMCSTLTNPHD